MKIGKVETHILQEVIIDQIAYKHEDVLIRSAVGEDCAAVSFGDYNLIITTDPITGTTAEIGGLSIDIVCNDIASNGVKPLGILLTILVPESTTTAELKKVMVDASRRAAELEVEIIGGHTEVTSAVNRMIISATAIGKQHHRDLVRNQTSQAEDIILVTKSAGLEGAGIIAYEKGALLKGVLMPEELTRAKEFLKQTSVVAEGLIAGAFKPSAMHDVTEGGILGALYELCEASGLGCVINGDLIPVEVVTQKICQYFGIEPFKLISSGAMLIVIEENRAASLEAALRASGIACVAIGSMTADVKRQIGRGGMMMDIEPPQSDALYDVLR